MSIRLLTEEAVRELLSEFYGGDADEPDEVKYSAPVCTNRRSSAEPCGTLLIPSHDPYGVEITYACPACDLPGVEDPLRNP